MRSSFIAVAATLLFPLTIPLSGAHAQDIGIASCDNFLKTYATCVATKVPEAQRAQMTSTMDQIKTNWKAVAATAEGKTQLEGVCKQTAEQMKAQTASLGCTW